MATDLTDPEFSVYLELLVKTMRGARSTLRATDPAWADKLTELIEMPRQTIDEIQMLLLKAHQVIIDGRSAANLVDAEAASLLDAIHNLPYGLLGRFDGRWDWRQALLEGLRGHEQNYLCGFRKYSGMLKPIQL